jgi:mannitol/fructose-specific phosphotransferase system IIA component (Ntr-type)
VKLSHLLKPEHILLDIPVETREEVLSYVAQHLEREGAVRNAQDLVDLLLDRERLGATVVGEETAIPHCKVPGLKHIVAVFARLRAPIQFGADEGGRVRLFFFVLSPREQPAAHLQVLANIARLLRNPAARRSFLETRTAEALSSAINRLEAVG